MRDKSGYAYIEVTVHADGIPMTQIHPVLDNYNKAVRDPNSFDVNTAIMRGLTKAISLHGLGLYIFAGEDLPDTNEMIAKIKLSYSEIHRIIEALAYTIQMRDESDGPAMKGLKSLKKDIQDIRNSMDNLYQNKILDGDKAPDTIRPEPKCKVCED